MQNWFKRGKGLQVGIGICCLSAFVLFGYEQGVFGPILRNENWLHQFGHPSDSVTGIIVSCYNLGCLVGCVSTFSQLCTLLSFRMLNSLQSQLSGRREAGPTENYLGGNGLHLGWNHPPDFCFWNSPSHRWTHYHWYRDRNGECNCANVSSSISMCFCSSPCTDISPKFARLL